MKNRQFLLKSRPTGKISRSNFDFVTTPTPDLKDGEVLVQNRYISLDPTHRIWMSDIEQYMPPIGIGEVIRSLGIGEVVESRSEVLHKGDIVTGLLGWQDYSVHHAKTLDKLPKDDSLPVTAYLSVLGLTGLTAYFGLLDITHPKAGETLVVSGAAGAVGSIVGQIGKIKGLRVVGIAGSADKCRHLVEDLGFDAAVNYRSPEFAAELKRACPKGVDVYFDNVGGEVSDAVWANMNLFGRVSLCGLISSYNGTPAAAGPRNFSLVLMKRLNVRGFILFDFKNQFPKAVTELYQWVKSGKIKYSEDIVPGLATAPDTVNKLFDGSNTGKLIISLP